MSTIGFKRLQTSEDIELVNMNVGSKAPVNTYTIGMLTIPFIVTLVFATVFPTIPFTVPAIIALSISLTWFWVFMEPELLNELYDVFDQHTGLSVVTGGTIIFLLFAGVVFTAALIGYVGWLIPILVGVAVGVVAFTGYLNLGFRFSDTWWKAGLIAMGVVVLIPIIAEMSFYGAIFYVVFTALPGLGAAGINYMF